MPACLTRYYPNYYVHTGATIRTYYVHEIDMIQISQHYYITSDLCEMFTSMMANAWCVRLFLPDTIVV